MVQAKNDLKSYAYNFKYTLNDEYIRDKVSAEDRSTIERRFKKSLSGLKRP